MDFQRQKNIVLEYYKTIEKADKKAISEVLRGYTTAQWLWRGYHPFDCLTGSDTVAECFWKPFLSAFSTWHRRQDIFFAGQNALDSHSGVWVVSMGHLVGLFDRAFLGIPPTGKMAFLRYCEFNKVENGRISETAFYFDLPHLMVQAGLQPFTTQRGAQLVQPGPMTHDGLLFNATPVEQGQKTLALINAMIADLGQWQSDLPLEEELVRTWHDDMIWWGPTGIGASYTIERYAKQHCAPFRAAFNARSKTNHICRMAEGEFGGFFGWPNFTAKLKTSFLDVPASDIMGEFRVIDIYRRHGDKLAENWVFIDLLHWMSQYGINVLHN